MVCSSETLRRHYQLVESDSRAPVRSNKPPSSGSHGGSANVAFWGERDGSVLVRQAESWGHCTAVLTSPELPPCHTIDYCATRLATFLRLLSGLRSQLPSCHNGILFSIKLRHSCGGGGQKVCVREICTVPQWTPALQRLLAHRFLYKSSAGPTIQGHKGVIIRLILCSVHESQEGQKLRTQEGMRKGRPLQGQLCSNQGPGYRSLNEPNQNRNGHSQPMAK